MDGALINRPGIAAFDELNLHNSPSLKEKVIFPKLLQGYYAQTVHRPIEQMEAIVNGIVGISGSSTVVELFMTANRLPRQSHSILLSNGEIKKCEGIDPGAGPDSGMLSVHCYYPGDIRNLFTNGEKLTLLSA
ncbi:hypothetical protein [Vibrio parahaemolyticus]|uniref:hypothetical protein n=1 Tax=Vibrio parahaemolyticus TaxID=670 RepID=UPI00133167A9|nr:hypothetical protein [Vibrio parahaemolyticus]